MSEAAKGAKTLFLTSSARALAEDVSMAIAALSHTDAPCVLCGKPARGTGVWIPGPIDAMIVDPPGGKHRLVLYRLCADHDPHDVPTLERVEAIIVKHLHNAPRGLRPGWVRSIASHYNDAG